MTKTELGNHYSEQQQSGNYLVASLSADSKKKKALNLSREMESLIDRGHPVFLGTDCIGRKAKEQISQF